MATAYESDLAPSGPTGPGSASTGTAGAGTTGSSSTGAAATGSFGDTGASSTDTTNTGSTRTSYPGSTGDRGVAHDTGHAVKERVGAIWDEAKETARSKIDQQKDSAAEGIDQVAGALRSAAQRQRGDGASEPMARITGSAADGLERLSDTLRNKDVSAMLRDLDSFARNQPVAFFGLALAAGFLAVRFLKAGND